MVELASNIVLSAKKSLVEVPSGRGDLHFICRLGVNLESRLAHLLSDPNRKKKNVGERELNLE